MSEMVTPYIAVDFACVRENLYEEVKDSSDVPVFPVETVFDLSVVAEMTFQTVSRFRVGAENSEKKLSNTAEYWCLKNNFFNKYLLS